MFLVIVSINDKVLEVWVVIAVNEPLCQILWQGELEEDWLLVGEELDDENFSGVFILHKNQFISSDVPIGQGSLHRPLKDHLSRLGPHLQQECFATTLLLDLLVVDLNQHWAEFDTFLKETGGDNFIKFVKWHMIGNLVHVLLRRVALAILQAICLVRFLNSSQKLFLVVGDVLFGEEGRILLHERCPFQLLVGVRGNCRIGVGVRVHFIAVVDNGLKLCER